MNKSSNKNFNINLSEGEILALIFSLHGEKQEYFNGYLYPVNYGEIVKKLQNVLFSIYEEK